MEYQRGIYGVLDTDDRRDSPLLLLDGGIERRSNESYDYNNRLRPGYEGYVFQYTLRGQGCYLKQGKSYEITEEHGFLVSVPEDSRYFLPKADKQEWEFLYIHFSGIAASPFIKNVERLGGSPFCLWKGSEPVRIAMAIQEKLMSGYRLEKYEGGELLYHFLSALLRELEYPGTEKNSSLVERAKRLMKERFSNLEGVESLSAEMGVSPSHFSRTFRKKTGITPVQYLTNVRIQNAMNHLLNTDYGMDKIAKENGFSNGNYFCKVFRKVVGESPMEYRLKRRD